MSSLSHKEDFKWSLALTILNIKEVREDNFTYGNAYILINLWYIFIKRWKKELGGSPLSDKSIS